MNLGEEEIDTGLDKDSRQDEASDLVDISTLSYSMLLQKYHQTVQENKVLAAKLNNATNTIENLSTLLSESKAENMVNQVSFVNGFPSIDNMCNTTQSSSGTGMACNIVYQRTYNVTFDSADFLKPANLALHTIARALSYQAINETNYMFLVFALFVEIISAIPLFRQPGNEVTVFQEKHVGSLRPDTHIVKNQNGVPFFVIEIKKPTVFKPNNTKLPRIYGQMFDYLFTLRTLYGVQKPYGVISTYEEYKICWLPDIDAVNENDEDNDEDKDDKDDKRVNKKGVKVERVLCVSDHTWTSLDPQETAKAIATALLDGFNSSVIPPFRGEKFIGSFKLFTPNTIEFRSVQIRPLFKYPEDAENFYIIDRFHPGIEGKAYHVFTENGEQGVLKFPIQIRVVNPVVYTMPQMIPGGEEVDAEGQRASLEKEQKYWKEINGITTRIVRAKNRSALLMPYLVPLSENERKDPEIYEQITALYESCASKGYFQEDASWRHLGWYKYEEPPSIKLLDFGHIEVFAKPDTSKEFLAKKKEKVDEMLDMLNIAPKSQQDGVMSDN